MEASVWENCFEGREEQLEWLKQHWQSVKKGQPKLITIVGDSGLGKTRLVQELFAYLSQDATEDPSGYWPSNLDKGRNLACNPLPSTVKTDVDIPWLWWGMRFPIPRERNQVLFNSPFIDQDPNLAIHAIPILRMRKRKEAQWDSVKTLSTILADAASFGVYGQAISILDMIKQRGIDKENTYKSSANALAKEVEEVVEQTLATLCMFLKPVDTDAPTVPVIMLIDDAQWMDMVTLQAINTLMTMALDENWPLLIVSTHWQKEWNQYPRLDIYQHSTLPDNLKQLVDLLNHRVENSALTLPLKKLNEHNLSPVVKAALPGIGQVNQEYLLKEADGNPRVLEEMIRLLLNRPTRYFVKGDITAELSSQGLKRLSKIQATDIFKLITERFDELEPRLQDLLSTGALIGPEFLKPLVIDMLVCCGESTPDFLSNIGVISRQAQDLHALVHSKSKETDVFQQKLYQTVALNYLKDEDEDRYQALLDSQSKVYRQWLKPEKYQQLEVAEQNQLFELILEFACSTEQHNLPPIGLAELFEKLCYFYSNSNQQRHIAGWWEQLLQQPESFLIEFALTLQTNQHGLLTLLEYNSNQEESVCLFEMLLTPHLNGSNDLNESKWHGVFGRLYSDYTVDVYDKARFHYQQQNFKAKASSAASPETEESLSAFSESLTNIADWILKAEYDESNKEFYYGESLEIRGNIEARYSETHKLETSSEGYKGQLPYYYLTAMVLYSESLKLDRDIVARFGESPEHLYDISQSLINVADLACSIYEDITTAEAYYVESLQICRDIVNRYGESPQRLRDISVSLHKVASLNSDLTIAEAYYVESLQICRDIVNRSGESPQRLRDISVSLKKLAKVADIHSDVVSAEALFAESLQIDRDIAARFGKNPQRLKDIAISLQNLASFTKDPESKIAFRAEAFEISESALDRYVKPGMIEDLLVAKALSEISEAIGDSESPLGKELENTLKSYYT